jgi:hypothetical protein
MLNSVRLGLTVLAAAAIFIAGYKVASWRHSAGRLQEVAAALEDVRQQQKLVDIQSRKLLQDNINISKLIADGDTKSTVLLKTIVRTRYVSDNRACDVPAAAISLRNDIADAYDPLPVGSPQ